MGLPKILAGGPDDGMEVRSDCRYFETPVCCTGGMVCRAVYERAYDPTGNYEYVFRGVAHMFQVGEYEYESRMESPEDWQKRMAEGRDYAPTNFPVLT